MEAARRGPWWSMAIAALALSLAGLYPLDNPDTFGHLAAGRQIAALGHVPLLDTFSFFRPAPQAWVNYEWLSDLVFFEVYALGGFGALTILELCMLALLGAVLVRRAHERDGPLAASLTTILLVFATAATRFRFTVRPHLFGMLFGALYLVGLTRLAEARTSGTRQSRLIVPALAVLHVLWVNLHGSHLLGLLLTAIFCAGSLRDEHARKPLLSLLGLQVAGSFISPYGGSILRGAIAHVADPAYRAIVEEWQAWSPDRPAWLIVAVLLQCLAMLFALRNLRSDALRPITLATFAVLALMALRSLRFIPEFLLLSSPLLAEALAPAVRKLTVRGQRALLRSGLGIALVAAPCLAVTVPPGRAFGMAVDTSHSPAAIGGFLEQHAQGARVFSAIEDAWYLMFAAPSARFLVDGRVPFYGPAHMQAMIAAWASPAALRQTLDRFQVDAVVIQQALGPQQTALHALEAMPDFHLVRVEDRHALFLRDLPTRSELLRRTSLHALRAGYDARFVLGANVDEAALRGELAQQPRHPNARAYQSFVRGMLALRPLARAEGHDGFAAPADASSRAGAAAALSSLRAADQALLDVPVVLVHHALAALLACQLDEARRTLARVPTDQQTRETLLASEELALREGDVGQVRTFVTQARAQPELAKDGWLAALSDSLAKPPACR